MKEILIEAQRHPRSQSRVGTGEVEGREPQEGLKNLSPPPHSTQPGAGAAGRWTTRPRHALSMTLQLAYMTKAIFHV